MEEVGNLAEREKLIGYSLMIGGLLVLAYQLSKEKPSMVSLIGAASSTTGLILVLSSR